MKVTDVYEKEINISDVEYDSFVFKKQKYIVLNNDLIDIDEELVQPQQDIDSSKNNKRIILGVLGFIAGKNILMHPIQEEYDEAVEFYLNLKRAFLKGDSHDID